MASNAVARKYTNISFDEIRSHLMDIVRAKEGPLADMGDSAYGKLMLELFAGYGDLTANWVESGFENSWLETAYSKPAILAGARSIGYSVRRPMPAKCSIGVRVSEIREHGTLKVFIPKGTVFTMSGSTLTTMSDMEFAYDYDTDTAQTGLMELTSGLNVLAEGYRKTEVLVSNGRQNQVFYVNDPTFSDYFGENDPNYAEDGDVAHRSACFTTVSSDATLVDNVDESAVLDDRLYWRVSRRGLEDPARDEGSSGDIEKFASDQGNYTGNYTVLVGTANDGSVSLKFGDGLSAAIPLGNIEVSYFSTSGEAGNRLGVFGTELTTTGSGITITDKDGLEVETRLTDIHVCLVTDIRGGLNIESNDSIRNNAPGVYNTLDRLVTAEAYRIFLRRYADVKYAAAFGEDVLNTKLLNGGINVKYMNQVRFTALKDLYREKNGKYYPTSEDEYLLDGYKVNGLMYNWLYDFQDPNPPGYLEDPAGVMKKVSAVLPGTVSASGIMMSDEEMASLCASLEEAIRGVLPSPTVDTSVFSAFLTPLDFTVEGSELDSIMRALNRRGMLTVGGGFHNYVYPSVHSMDIVMDVVLFNGNSFTDVRERIKTLVYKYLKDNTGFGTPVYRSKIASLVHSMPEVAGVDVTFKVSDSAFAGMDLAEYPWYGEPTAAYASQGTTSYYGTGYTLSGTYTGGDTRRFTVSVPVGEQGTLRNAISEYYAANVAPAVEGGRVTDRLIDRFVAFIWNGVMQEIYSGLVAGMNDAYNTGSDDALLYRSVLEAVKGWTMEGGAILFKDTPYVTGMKEVSGTGLFDYMRYAMDYIKLARRVLVSKSTQALIDQETGNVTGYSNENEIVQFSILNDNITLRVGNASTARKADR